MTKALLILFLFAIAATPAQAVSLFWVAAPMACIASAGDGVSTAMAISAGAHETNPVLTQKNTGHNGNLNLPLEIAGKATVCAIPFLIRRLFRRGGDSSRGNAIGAGVGFAAAGTYTWAVHHNLEVLKQQKAMNRGAQ